MGIPNIEESIWTKYKKVVEINKEKRKYTDGDNITNTVPLYHSCGTVLSYSEIPPVSV